MPIENSTANRNYPLPHEDNKTAFDVLRLINALSAIDADMATALVALIEKAPLASPAFSGAPTAPTPSLEDDTNKLATTAFVQAAKVALGNSFLSKADAGKLSAFRNKIINGNFDIWERGASQTTSGYGSDDRWRNEHTGSTKVHSRQSFSLGQADVPGNPSYYSRTVVASVSGASNFVTKLHRIEGVSTLAGRIVTITFWAKSDANRNISLELRQNFGTGGTPSAPVSLPLGLKALTAAWQKFTFTATIPAVAGKIIGSNNNDYIDLIFWLEAGSSFSTRASGLIQQSGTFDIARVSIVDGDATSEEDSFSPRHIQQEISLCQRYFWKNLQGENLLQGHITTAGAGYYMNFRHPVPMRGIPTMTATFATSGNIGTPGLDRINPRTFLIGVIGTSTGGAFSIDTSAPLTADAEL